MNPEERSLLERTYKLIEENNEILKSLRRTSRIGTAIKIFYWVIIIGTTIGAFYFVKPYLEFMTGALGIGGITDNTNNASASQEYIKNLQDLLK